jgi:hypothetical protein
MRHERLVEIGLGIKRHWRSTALINKLQFVEVGITCVIRWSVDISMEKVGVFSRGGSQAH